MIDVSKEIGVFAGVVWEKLSQDKLGGISDGVGEGFRFMTSLEKDLKKKTGVRSDTFRYAIGWLAREGKVEFVHKGRSVLVRVTEG